MVSEYDAVMVLDLPSTSWNINQLKSVLKALKIKEDGAIPTRKADLIVKYEEWKGRAIHRGRGDASAGEVAVIAVPKEENEASTTDEDCINAMMMPNEATGFCIETEEI